MPQSHWNRLLKTAATEDFERLRPHFREVTLDYKMSLYKANTPIKQIYFPVEGVASLVSTMSDGSSAEVGTIGNEGVVGIPVILGDETGTTDVYVQVPGIGLEISSSVVSDVMDTSKNFRTLMLHYAHTFFNQVAQSAACGHFHSIEQRCCRWLLMTHDRVQSDNFLLTQEFLAMMIGVRRSSVTDVAIALKNKGLIEYSRGHVQILDRPGLVKGSCECYAVSKREFDKLLGASRN